MKLIRKLQEIAGSDKTVQIDILDRVNKALFNNRVSAGLIPESTMFCGSNHKDDHFYVMDSDMQYRYMKEDINIPNAYKPFFMLENAADGQVSETQDLFSVFYDKLDIDNTKRLVSNLNESIYIKESDPKQVGFFNIFSNPSLNYDTSISTCYEPDLAFGSDNIMTEELDLKYWNARMHIKYGSNIDGILTEEAKAIAEESLHEYSEAIFNRIQSIGYDLLDERLGLTKPLQSFSLIISYNDIIQIE